MNKNVIGSVSELKAIIWLLEQGYEVFNNVRAHGSADLIAWDEEQNIFLAIDVKTIKPYIKKDGTKSYFIGNKSNIKDNVTYLGYNPDEDLFMWCGDLE